MKYVDEFRAPEYVLRELKRMENKVSGNITIMEVCGTHTMAIARFGLRKLLPSSIRLISGPGCPVCVTTPGYVDSALELANKPDTIITTFGDLIRVPGKNGNLLQSRAKGDDIRIVYSPLDALKVALENPEKQVIFLAVGFETTAPVIALALLQAKRHEVGNFSILHSLKTMPKTMDALLQDPELAVDAFLCPGHVSTIIGAKPYETIAAKSGKPMVISGFEAADITRAISELVTMHQNKEAEVRNRYERLVSYKGNRKALDTIEEIFQPFDAKWRGIGIIPESGLTLKPAWQAFDAEKRFEITVKESSPPKNCLCGEILTGKATPRDCKLFGKGCTPTNPVGACMVSEEGTCAAFYHYC